MKRIFGTRRRKIATITTVLALAIGGTALAAWVISGSGTSGGQVGTPAGLTAVRATPTEQLYPAGTGGAAFDVSNTNGFPVTITEADFSGAITAAPACDTSAISAVASVTGLSFTVPAGGHLVIDLPAVYSATADLDNACQGSALTDNVDLVGHSG